MTKWTIAFLPCVAVGATVACLPEPPVACTDEARSSVQVTVVDDNGTPLEVASVTMQPTGQEESPCDRLGDPGEFTCGFEIDGDSVVRAQAVGYTSAEQTVTVGRTEDDCHVETESVTLRLIALDG